MLTIEKAFYTLKDELEPLYDVSEATAIAHSVLEYITGLSKLQRISDKHNVFTRLQQQSFDVIKADLLKGKPLQHITGVQWFMGRQFYVNEHVLIPRPETEELVQWITDDCKSAALPLNIIDIGTGSGCISIALKLMFPAAVVTTLDISEDAIEVAKKNAKQLNAAIDTKLLDFIDESHWQQLGSYDLIVSNPPYIPFTAREELHTNVKDFEPPLALFVPADEPLLFYKAIARFGKEHLHKRGAIYCELHRDNAMEAKEMFINEGYETVLKKDMNDNWRMLRASLNIDL